MSTRKFNWDNFDRETVTNLINVFGNLPDRPNESFVKITKDVLIDNWFSHSDGERFLPKVIKELRRRQLGNQNYSPNSINGMRSFLKETRNTINFQKVILSALKEHGKEIQVEFSSAQHLPPQFHLSPKNAVPDTRKPHYYQVKVWKSLDKEFENSKASGKFAGLLVMPTGSGKTFTAARWLMQNVISKGGRVLWIAHRHELLEQATLAFAQNVSMANKDSLKFRLISGIHCPVTTIKPTDDIIVSMPYISRRKEILDDLLTDKNLFVVIDEAHHAPASTYVELIKAIKARGKYNLLGLTATPTRTADNEKPILSKLFDDKVIENISTKELIEQKFLATPKPVSVKTNYHVDANLTNEDEKHIQKFHEISEEWKERIAGYAQRNDIILRHYQEKRNIYGKTLIFALNIHHAELLKEKFNKAGINAEAVTSYSLTSNENDEATLTKSEILEKFRDNNSGLDVLINVQILTEGVDIPEIKTIFLTRPTVSETLLRQMIGRALRGVQAGGTEIAYIVSFEDHWERFRNWQSPLELVADIIPPELKVELKTDEEKVVREAFERIPWETIRQVANAFSMGQSTPLEQFEAIPVGWYVLNNVGEEDDDIEVETPICVYEHQRKAFYSFVEYLLKNKGKAFNVEAIFDMFFSDCEHPKPSDLELVQVCDYISETGKKPLFVEYEEREKINPLLLARKIIKEELGPTKQRELLKLAFAAPLAKAIYIDFDRFNEAINQAISFIQEPKDSNFKPKGTPVFEDEPELPLRKGNGNINLSKLLQEVCLEGGMEGAKIIDEILHFSGNICWTKRRIKGWFGMAIQQIDSFEKGKGEIKINILLDSPDVPEHVVKFLIWHEYLHLYLGTREGHSREFRRLERKWPSYVESDRWLDNFILEYKIEFYSY